MKSRKRRIDQAPAQEAGAARAALAWRIMARRNAVSGGFFITMGAIVGAVTGLLLNALMQGLVGGTALGIAAAVGVWLVDRRRG